MSLLFNPYNQFSERQLLLTGFLLLLIGSLLAFYFNARFDGVFDLHFVESVPFTQPFSDNVIVVVCLFICLFVAGKFTNIKTRPVDILALSLISRIPIYILVFANANNLMYDMSSAVFLQLRGGNLNIPAADLTIIVLFTIISIAALVWFVALLYNGFKVATNAKSIRPIIFFSIALLVSEILSKFIFSNLLML